MSDITDKKLCVVLREISNFYNLEGCSQFQCPMGTVLCGLSFDFEHPEFQQFEYGTLAIKDPSSEGGQSCCKETKVSFGPVEWSDMIEDAEIGFDLPEGRFIVGMKMYIHSGKISFKVATSEVKVDGFPVYFSKRMASAPIMVEDVQNWFVANEDCVLSGIHIYSEKNIQTGFFCFGTLSLTKPKKALDLPFEIVVALHPDERYYPMNATDYIRVSRLRKRHTTSQEPDPCYDTRSKQFVPEEMHLHSFYNIDPKVLNSFHSYEPGRRLFNLRPHDLMSLKDHEVYLQPMVKIRGDIHPNGRRPVYTRVLTYNLIGIGEVTYYDFWLFFGYNYDVRRAIKFSHQGDWQHVMVKVKDGKIIAAWLSQHDRFEGYTNDQLEIIDASETEEEEVSPDNPQTTAATKPVLKIYCACGTHALYPKVGSFSLMEGICHEHTQSGGYQWKITDCTEDLEAQPWRDFAGAWGEIGEFSHSTGPLGPWYRRFDFWYQDKVALESITKEEDIVIVADDSLMTTQFEESRDTMSEAPKQTVLVGLKHCGDENGTTRCVYSSLKAIDHQGNTMDGKIEIENAHWDEWFKESDSLYNAPDGYVILDRQHVGDENGNTRFKIGRITFEGKPTSITPADAFIVNQIYIESQGVFFRTNPYFLMVGTQHTGDENGDTVNFQGLVTVVRNDIEETKVKNEDETEDEAKESPETENP